MNNDGLRQYLTGKLLRHECSSTFELGEYHLGMLGRKESRTITTHLEQCHLCRRELTIYAQWIDVPQSEPSVLERITVWIAKLLDPPSQPIFAVRGDEEETQIFKAKNGTQIAIDIQPDDENIGYFAVVGMIIGGSNSHFVIDLWYDDTLHNQVTTNDLGNFHLNHLEPGNYELIVKGSTLLFHIQTLKV